MMQLYLHPLSSYSQKAIMAFYEKDVPFAPRLLDNGPTSAELAELWPIARFPILTDQGRMVFEATGIIEYLDARHPTNPRLIPADPLAAVEVRMWDRFFDNYVSTPQGHIVFASIGREPPHEAAHRAALDTAYAVLDQRMRGRDWVAGDGFSMADCAAAPALLYADWTHPIPPGLAALHAYRARLLARPSYARALDEARPYRHLFPLGAPEGRD